MSAPPKPVWTRQDYDRDADEYLAGLPLEHFMESTPQAAQRKATLASLEQLLTHLSGFRCFNELLVQWRVSEGTKQVVPDNMVVLDFSGDEAFKSWAVELAPCPIFWMLEYVSESNRRKDYVDSFEKYERDLKVPYYLIFDPDHQDLRLYRHNGTRYVPVEANAQGRYPIPEIDVEVAVHERWTRFWYKGKLLPLTREMQAELSEVRTRLDAALAKLEQAEKERETAEKQRERAEKERENAEKEKAEAERERDRAEVERERAEKDRENAEKERERAEKDRENGEKERERAEKERERAEKELQDAEHWRKLAEARASKSEQRLNDQKQAMAATLRPLVEARARLNGRQDVLEQLAEADADQLLRWLADLG